VSVRTALDLSGIVERVRTGVRFVLVEEVDRGICMRGVDDIEGNPVRRRPEIRCNDVELAWVALFQTEFFRWIGRPRTFIRHTLSTGNTAHVVPGTGAATLGPGVSSEQTRNVTEAARIIVSFMFMAIGSGPGYG